MPCPLCQAETLPRKLLCVTHWQQVPQHLQYRVYRCWATYRAAKNPRLVVMAAQALREAQERAVESVTGVTHDR